MIEERIRSQTKVILEAYIAAVGINPVPDISDFLKVRAAAISELEKTPENKQHIQTFVEESILPQKAIKQMDHKQEKTDALTSTKEPVSASISGCGQKTQTAQASQVTQFPAFQPQLDFASPDAETNKTKQSAPIQKSSFELLRGIKDPWND